MLKLKFLFMFVGKQEKRTGTRKASLVNCALTYDILFGVFAGKESRELVRLFGGVPTLLEEENGEVHELVLQ